MFEIMVAPKPGKVTIKNDDNRDLWVVYEGRKEIDSSDDIRELVLAYIHENCIILMWCPNVKENRGHTCTSECPKMLSDLFERLE